MMGTVLLVEDDPEIRHPLADEPARDSAVMHPARGPAAAAMPEVAR